jgi:hypothetical protein
VTHLLLNSAQEVWEQLHNSFGMNLQEDMARIAMEDAQLEDQEFLEDVDMDDDGVDLELEPVIALAEIKRLNKKNQNLVDLLQVESEERRKIAMALSEVEKHLPDLKIQNEEGKIICENLEN